MLQGALHRTRGRLPERGWWEPLLRSTCGRCGQPVGTGERRIIDGRGPTVSVMHWSCLFYPATPPIDRAESRSQRACSDLRPVAPPP
jgi:hypothetical protein